jgi:hypothetical protein
MDPARSRTELENAQVLPGRLAVTRDQQKLQNELGYVLEYEVVGPIHLAKF